MSSDAPDWNAGSKAAYKTECRKCDHTIRTKIPVGAVQHNVDGVRVRCKECRTTNFIKREVSAHE